ncbi:hypothetical protein Dimus_003465 [Dionaea muscipula]
MLLPQSLLEKMKRATAEDSEFGVKLEYRRSSRLSPSLPSNFSNLGFVRDNGLPPIAEVVSSIEEIRPQLSSLAAELQDDLTSGVQDGKPLVVDDGVTTVGREGEQDLGSSMDAEPFFDSEGSQANGKGMTSSNGDARPCEVAKVSLLCSPLLTENLVNVPICLVADLVKEATPPVSVSLPLSALSGDVGFAAGGLVRVEGRAPPAAVEALKSQPIDRSRQPPRSPEEPLPVSGVEAAAGGGLLSGVCGLLPFGREGGGVAQGHRSFGSGFTSDR